MTDIDDHSSPVRSAPSVSVLVTTFNHARYVEEALESLRRQTSRDFEVIITDDASSDGCADIIATWLSRTGFAAQFIRNPVNRGICANRNAALARASGSFVCSLSGDDSYEPERIERQLGFFRSQPESVCAVYSDMRMIDADGRPLAGSFLQSTLGGRAPPQGDLFEHLLAGNFLPAPAVMVRRSAIAAVGGYDENLFYEDLDMWLRLGFRFRFAFLPGLLVRYRTFADSMSSAAANQPAMHRSYTRILKKWLGAGLEDSAHRRVLDELLRNAAVQLRIRDSEGARATFDVVLGAERLMSKRLLARIGMLPGMGTAIRLLQPLYRRYRALAGPPAP